jgi:SAM-dependent methyltransferase
MTVPEQALYAYDLERTRRNRERLRGNGNLLYWYRRLYGQVFPAGLEGKRVLEIGSGTSPLKLLYPGVETSDVLRLDYLDHVFDCQEIDAYGGIPGHSLDIITLTNVLHHLKDPLGFLAGAAAKLKPGGELVLAEPYFSLVSYPVYKLLHPEPVDFSVVRHGLAAVEGPLSTSNQAVPYMLLFSRRDWLAGLADQYDLDGIRVDYFSSLSYMATGGISRVFPVPGFLYRALFGFDNFLARTAPRIFASFFTAVLTARPAPPPDMGGTRK